MTHFLDPKQDSSRLLGHLPIREVCLQLGVNFRDRCLDPATTAALFIRQVIDGNSSCAQVRHRGDRRFSAAAYCKARMRLPLAESIIVRELRRRVYRPELNQWVELVIVTTLPDESACPAEKLVELRLRRWQVEVNLRHLKTTMGLNVLKCKTAAGVRKELAAFALVYNLIRLIMLEAAARQKTQPDRISFADVLGWVRVARAGVPMPRFIINPRRPGRVEPRARKRRPKNYPLLTRPRQEMRNALKNRAKQA